MLQNLVEKAGVGFEMIGSNFEKVPLWVKRCQRASHATEKLFLKGRISQWANVIIVSF